MKFELEVGRDQIEILWFDPLGSRFSPAYRELADELEGVDGVEAVAVHRYSAEVRVAGHAVDAWDVVADVHRVLQARYPHATIETTE